MRVERLILVLIIMSSCKSVEIKRPLDLLNPKQVRLGTSLSDVSNMVSLDTSKCTTLQTTSHIKGHYVQQTMQRFIVNVDLPNWRLTDNLYDSIYLDFLHDKLFRLSFYLSNNQKIEILKFRLKDNRRYLSSNVWFRGILLQSKDSTFKSGVYRELHYRFRKGKLFYDYREDIIDNVSVLDILNGKMAR